MSEPDDGNVLTINFDQTSEYWYAAVQNNVNVFQFCGETPSEQLLRAQRLAELMKDADRAAIVDELPVLLNWPMNTPSGTLWTSDAMFDLLFSDTTAIETVTTDVFLAPAGSFLVTVLEAAGDFLAAALAL